MFGWIPILGPIIDGIVHVVNGFTNLGIAKVQAQAQIETTSIQATAKITETFKDDIGVRLSRDIVMFPTAVWAGLTVWDSIVVHHWPDLLWNTGVILKGSGLEFLPYLVLTFLFGLNVMRFFKRG